VNVENSWRRGIELEAGWQASPWIRLDGNATLSDNRVAQFEETVYDYAGPSYENRIQHSNTDLALSPNAVAMGMLTLEPPKESPFAGVSLSLIAKHVGRQFLDNTSNENRMLDSFATVDAVLRTESVMPKGQTVSVSLFGNNLLDAMYSATGWTYSYWLGGSESEITETYVYPQAGRHGFITLAVEF